MAPISESIPPEKRLKGVVHHIEYLDINNINDGDIDKIREKLFEIPDTWCWCRLGDLANKITEENTP